MAANLNIADFVVTVTKHHELTWLLNMDFSKLQHGLKRLDTFRSSLLKKENKAKLK